MAVSPVYPPVVGLGRLAGWSPLPLTIRDARRRAARCRDRLADREIPDHTPTTAAPATARPAAASSVGGAARESPEPAAAPPRTPPRSAPSPSAGTGSRRCAMST